MKTSIGNRMDFKITIIGAGVIGLAIAEKLSAEYENILVIERHDNFGRETSSRNSEVIHSGIYYPPDSLKAKLCIEGKALLYDYCLAHNINYNKCGKMLISTNSTEEEELKKILQHSVTNGVEDGRIIGREEISYHEPNVNAVSAIYYPSSGIIDSHELMRTLETVSLKNGVEFAYNHKVTGLKKIDGGYSLSVVNHKSDHEVSTEVLINCGGLDAFNISSLLGLNKDEYRLFYWKGEYFSVSDGKSNLINSLIYPIPEKNITGLGVHVTIDLGGRLKLGPNAIFMQNGQLDYTVSDNNRISFFNSAKLFLPFLEIDDLQPDMAGIRPKLQQPGDAFRDFIIKNETENGFHNFINLLGIESPGLTSSLAIAKFVSGIINT